MSGCLNLQSFRYLESPKRCLPDVRDVAVFQKTVGTNITIATQVTHQHYHHRWIHEILRATIAEWKTTFRSYHQLIIIIIIKTKQTTTKSGQVLRTTLAHPSLLSLSFPTWGSGGH